MTDISFDTTTAERAVLRDIAERGAAMALKDHGLRYSVVDAWMDLTAVHCNGCPLRLDDFLAADDFNFAHDFFGISRHIDRETGQLTDCFLPRFAAPQADAA